MSLSNPQNLSQIGLASFSALAVLCGFRAYFFGNNKKKQQKLCQGGIVIFSILAVCCGYGSYYFGEKFADTDKAKEAAEVKKLKAVDIITREIRNAKVVSSLKLAPKIALPKTGIWDFSQGTIAFILKETTLNNQKYLFWKIVSKDNLKIIKIVKDEDGIVKFIYQTPQLGALVRKAKVKQSDITHGGLLGDGSAGGVFVSFTWNLDEQKTTLYINGKERNENLNL